MAHDGEVLTYETESPLSIWEKELADREERVDAIREVMGDVLEPVLTIVDAAPSCFANFSSAEDIEGYFAGLVAAIKQVLPVVIGKNSGQLKIGDIVHFFTEVCGAPEDKTREAIMSAIHDGGVVWLEDHSLEAPQLEVT
jgi:hypothetical protein